MNYTYPRAMTYDEIFGGKPAKKKVDIRVGDKVTISHTGKVSRVNLGVITFENGLNILQDTIEEGQASYSVLQRPRPPVGSLMTERDFHKTPWRTGTIVRGHLSREMLVLQETGKWAGSLANQPMRTENMPGDYELIFDPSAAK